MQIDQTALYSESHEWIRADGDLWVVGISDWAQNNLGDIVFVELPKLGSQLSQGAVLGVVESVKAASDLYMPVEAEVVEVNNALVEHPSTLNTDPFGHGWIARVRLLGGTNHLMSAGAYEEFTRDL